MDIVIGIAVALLPIGAFAWTVTLPIVCRMYGGADSHWAVATVYGCGWGCVLAAVYLGSGTLARRWPARAGSFAARWGKVAKPNTRVAVVFVAVAASLSVAIVTSLRFDWTFLNVFLVVAGAWGIRALVATGQFVGAIAARA